LSQEKDHRASYRGQNPFLRIKISNKQRNGSKKKYKEWVQILDWKNYILKFK